MTVQLDQPGLTVPQPRAAQARRRQAARKHSDRTVIVYGRLNDRSAVDHHEAWSSVQWDDPANAIRRDDPRWQLPSFEPLGASDWYRAQPLAKRVAIGQQHTACTLTTGWMFENLLQRGLLDHSIRHHRDDAMFRYMQHEIADEAQHTMMFHELGRRLGYRSKGMGRVLVTLTERFVLPMNRHFPELFFVLVIGGEDPADHLQRLMIKEKADIHPLMLQIMRIHIAEESRHLSFARTYLQETVPHLGRVKRTALSYAAPAILGLMVRLMAHLHDEVVRDNGIPHDVLVEAYGTPAARQTLKDCAAKPRALCIKLGLVNARTQRLWERYGIWDERAA